MSRQTFRRVTVSTADNPPPSLTAIPQLSDDAIREKFTKLLEDLNRVVVVEVTNVGPPEQRCAWCDEERGYRYLGNVSHRVCFYHLVSNLWFCLPKDSEDTLFYAVLCQLGTEAA